MESRKVDQEQYDKLFKDDEKILEAALKQAYEVRKFEIELYWKRAAYFWAFIGAAFVGYAAFLKEQDHSGLLVIISCIGFVFSVAWHCVNKGSKHWQENWENHVELLEDKTFGPLYKTLTTRPGEKGSFANYVRAFFTAPKPFSVSKINQLVSTYIALIWAYLLYGSIGPICTQAPVDWSKAIPLGLSLLTCAGFWLAGMSHGGSHNPIVTLRTTRVNSD